MATMPAVRATSATLFGCLFGAQAALVVISPILVPMADDLGVSTAAAGQLRALSGAAAGLVAVGLVLARGRYGSRDVLAAGLALLATGVLSSAAAPTFAVLALAQVPLGAGLALVLAGGLAAPVAWTSVEHRDRVLSWALLGQPAAWIVGLPVMGALGDVHWRLAWLVPATACSVMLTMVLARPLDPVCAADGRARPPGVLRWAVAEGLAYAGWAGTLVYVGASFVDRHGASVVTVGILLGLGAAAYLPGNLLARHCLDHAAHVLLVGLAPAMAVTAILLFVLRPTLGASVTAFVLFGFLGGARTIAGSAVGLRLGDDPLRAMSLRAAAVQFGYFTGASLGGLGLAIAGWQGLGVVLAALLMASAGVLVAGIDRTRPSETLIRH